MLIHLSTGEIMNTDHGARWRRTNSTTIDMIGPTGFCQKFNRVTDADWDLVCALCHNPPVKKRGPGRPRKDMTVANAA